MHGSDVVLGIFLGPRSCDRLVGESHLVCFTYAWLQVISGCIGGWDSFMRLFEPKRKAGC